MEEKDKIKEEKEGWGERKGGRKKKKVREKGDIRLHGNRDREERKI